MKVVGIGSTMVELDHSNDLTKLFFTTLATNISPPQRFFFPFSCCSPYCDGTDSQSRCGVWDRPVISTSCNCPCYSARQDSLLIHLNTRDSHMPGITHCEGNTGKLQRALTEMSASAHRDTAIMQQRPVGVRSLSENANRRSC